MVCSSSKYPGKSASEDKSSKARKEASDWTRSPARSTSSVLRVIWGSDAFHSTTAERWNTDPNTPMCYLPGGGHADGQKASTSEGREGDVGAVHALWQQEVLI